MAVLSYLPKLKRGLVKSLILIITVQTNVSELYFFQIVETILPLKKKYSFLIL